MNYPAFVRDIGRTLGFCCLKREIGREREAQLRREWGTFMDILLNRADLVSHFFNLPTFSTQEAARMIQAFKQGWSLEDVQCPETMVIPHLWNAIFNEVMSLGIFMDPISNVKDLWLLLHGRSSSPIRVANVTKLVYLGHLLANKGLLPYRYQSLWCSLNAPDRTPWP